MTELETLLHTQWIKRDGTPDEKMADYCLKSSKYIDLGDYYLNIGNSKPGIDSTMWYDDTTKGPDSSKFEAFRAYNLRGNNAQTFDEVVNSGRTEFWVYTNYTVDRTNDKLRGWTASRPGDEPRHVGSYRKATADDIVAIKQGLAEIRADYEKRLKTYWKRYSNKVHAAGYWADR